MDNQETQNEIVYMFSFSTTIEGGIKSARAEEDIKAQLEAELSLFYGPGNFVINYLRKADEEETAAYNEFEASLDEDTPPTIN